MNTTSRLRQFDPRTLAHFEKENYVAYYQKDWRTLLRVSVRMVGEAFGLNWWQAIYGAYLVARAEIAFAPFPDNDVPLAEAYMRRFYRFINKVHGEAFDVAELARLEVRWWIVHRELFANPENQGLVDALGDLYVAVYGLPREQLETAVRQRALGMLYSDQWVRADKPANSPLLIQEEEALYQSYLALQKALQNN